MVEKGNIKNIFKDKNISMFGTFKIRYILLRLIVLWGILFIVSIFTNNIAIGLIPVKADELNNMICDMWEVQTTISVMFIALIALIINKLDDRIYGQSIKDILMIKGIFNPNPIKKFFNTSGVKYRELGLKDIVKTESEDKLLEILSSDGMLIKRPLVYDDKNVLLGFKEEEWKNTLL